MVFKRQKEDTVRRYLLQDLSESERQALELRLLIDDDLAEELEIVEDELIDEYLAKELSRRERNRFEEVFLANPERKKKLNAGQALKRYLRPIPSSSSSSPQPRSWLDGINSFVFSSPARAALGVFAVAVVGLFIWRAVF